MVVDSPPPGWIHHRHASAVERAERPRASSSRRCDSGARCACSQRGLAGNHRAVRAGRGHGASGANKQPLALHAIDDPAIKARSATPPRLKDGDSSPGVPPTSGSPTSTARHRRTQAVPRGRALADPVFKLMRTDADERRDITRSITSTRAWVSRSGLLVTALHHAGLAALTHTPSPMAFLAKILRRPGARAAVPAHPGRLPGRRLHRARHRAKPLGEI